jgi:hypothetical protein
VLDGYQSMCINQAHGMALDPMFTDVTMPTLDTRKQYVFSCEITSMNLVNLYTTIKGLSEF